jgi:GNAT superfamily N-acetyltransferase
VSGGLHFRAAEPDEADELAGMVMRGLAHWGHQERFPELIAEFEHENLPTPEFVRDNTVRVLEDDGRPVGFHGLRVEDEFVDLVYMFVEPTMIGTGLGRHLWDDAVTTGATLHRRMRILSDPGAVGFYRAMGAELEREVEVHPGFRLGLYWLDLDGHD